MGRRYTDRDRVRKLKNRVVAQAFVAELNARTFCAHCGAQPIEWHNPEHVKLNRRHYRISHMASNGRPVNEIQDEMTRCTPLCRRCHMAEDGRLKALIERVTAPRTISQGKPCIECTAIAKPLRRGLCNRCASRCVYYAKTESGENHGAVRRRLWDQKRKRANSTCTELDERAARLALVAGGQR
jgi:hypothetical protein